MKEKFLNLNPHFMLQIAFKIGSICITSFSFFVNENQSFALSICPILPSCSQRNFCPKIFSRVGSERGRLGKVSLYCLSSSLCCHQKQLFRPKLLSWQSGRCCCSRTARWARRWSSSRPRRIRVKSIAENVIFSLNKMYKLLQQM